jgi:hypothetical protein
MLELTLLIISIIIILVILLYKDNYISFGNKIAEGFDVSPEKYYLSSCPTGFNSYYDDNGNIMCCNGEVIANKCIGDTKCSLTSSTNPDSCVRIILDQYREKAPNFCPMKSMPTYFERGSIKACTKGGLNTTLDGPANSKQAGCVIYPDFKDNLTSIDSCLNQKKLDNAECFGNNCSKSLVRPGANLPILVGISFTDNNGMPHMAFTRESYEDALNIINPNWKEQGVDLSKNLQVAEVAKAYYFDRTIQQSDIQF